MAGVSRSNHQARTQIKGWSPPRISVTWLQDTTPIKCTHFWTGKSEGYFRIAGTCHWLSCDTQTSIFSPEKVTQRKRKAGPRGQLNQGHNSRKHIHIDFNGNAPLVQRVPWVEIVILQNKTLTSQEKLSHQKRIIYFSELFHVFSFDPAVNMLYLYIEKLRVHGQN